MESSETAGERPLTKLEIQLDLIGEAFGESFGKQLFADGTLDYLYVRGVILVRDAYLAEVARLLEEEDEPEERGQEFIPVEGLLPGVSLFSVGTRDVPRLLDKIDARLGVGRRDAGSHPVDHPGLALPGHRAGGRADGSLPTRASARAAGRHVHLRGRHRAADGCRPAHPWLAGVTGTAGPAARQGGVTRSRSTRATGRSSPASPAAWRPRRRVVVTRDFDKAGAISEHEIVLRLHEALGMAPDIISLSAGGTTRKDLPLLGFEAFWDSYRHYKGVVLVASAGNNSTRRPFWPAAFPQVVGVGALAANGRGRAYFSDSVPGWTCTPPARTWSTRTRPGHISTASRRISARTRTSTAWPGGAARPSPRRWSRGSSPPASPGPARTAGRRPARCWPRRARSSCPGSAPCCGRVIRGDCGDRLACCCGGAAGGRDCCC